MKYVIVGNGVASVGAIEGIRAKDPDGAILVISEEPELTYGRPLISYLLAGKIGLDRMALRSDEFYKKNNVEVMLDSKVEAIDPAKHEVSVSGGKTVKYEKLLVATGGSPFRPPIPGMEGPGVYSFTTLAHAKALIELSAKVKRVVVVGGGLIGLKAAESLHDRGVEVSIVELAPRVLSIAFDDKAGALVSKRLEEVGIKLFCNCAAKEFKRGEDGQVKGVLLADGRFLEADAIVVAIGVAANSGLAKAAGLNVERGVLVDDKLATSDPDIYAAGDVAQAIDMLAGDKRVVPIWPNAYNQGFAAGKNMAGAGAPYEGGLAMNSISFYGLDTVSVGTVNPGAEEKEYEVVEILDAAKNNYRKLVFKGGKLAGYVLVGDIDAAGVYTGYVRFGFPLTQAVKEELVAGRPSVLSWPAEFFDNKWNPGQTAMAV